MEQSDYVKEMLRLEQKDEQVKEKAFSMCSDLRIDQIQYDLENAEGFISCFDIVEEPIGDYDEEMNYWVNQTLNGGYFGDEYAGTICHKLTNGKYLKYHYSL